MMKLLNCHFTRRRTQARARIPEDFDRPLQAFRGRGFWARNRHDQLKADGIQEGRRLLPGLQVEVVQDRQKEGNLCRDKETQPGSCKNYKLKHMIK